MKQIKKCMAIVVMAAMLATLSIPAYAKNPGDYTDTGKVTWYFNYVKYVSEQDIMTGLNETTFGPMENLARAQFATILYRMAGSPETVYEDQFPDVPDGEFYSIPVTWAQKAGVITGYDEGNFGSADPLTREQMVTMMYRFAEVSGRDVSARADYMSFPDGYQVTEFAHEAMQWAVSEQIMQGTRGGLLVPGDSIIRAECAAIIARYNDAKAIYMPLIGMTYTNSTNGGFPHTAEIKLEEIDDTSFKLSVWEVIDENGRITEKEIIGERVAVFEDDNPGIAVTRDGEPELTLDCRTFGAITIGGLEEDLEMGNTFYMLGIGSIFNE